MDLFTLDQLRKKKKLGRDKANAWMRKQIELGLWDRVKVQGETYYVNIRETMNWHDILNLRARKPPEKAWADYVEARDGTKAHRPA